MMTQKTPNGKKQQITLWAFLLIELVLYYLILTSGGNTLVISSFLSIVICFGYALTDLKNRDSLFVGALGCTMGADFFLVVCSPIEQLWGMMFFLVAQTLYAIRLHKQNQCRTLIWLRVVLIACAEAVTVVILKEKTDALAVISIAYYANLIVNIIASFTKFRSKRLLPIGFVLFLLCDTVIGLQAASGVYLPISEGSLLHRIIYVNFNLAWFFYLPSQVLIALSSRKYHK
jgi:uncharacterized membrane protein YhhN